MQSTLRTLIGVVLALSLAASAGAQESSDSALPEPPPPPPIPRELRGVWVATVENIDWPGEPGLPVEMQQAQARAILDRAAEMNLNTIVFQVRPAADAMYPSDLEPWSYYLTGEQGQAPEPFYDPLAFWIREAHARGLELHVWLNPFRVLPAAGRYELSDESIGVTDPELVKDYGNESRRQLWMDPGEPEARARTLAVFADLVRRYDIDGVHMDDYFYPYPVGDIPFPDEAAYAKYREAGGELELDDFRRDAINDLVRQIYQQTKRLKPHVKVGISPFGIWRPGYPQSVQGFDQYDQLYADARLWLRKGWVDYWTPQLYWRISAPRQSFPQLLAWWAQQNVKERILAPGMYTGRIAPGSSDWPVEEILGQVLTTRAIGNLTGQSTGHVHFSMRSLTQNPKGVAEAVRDTLYPTPALVPAMEWIDRRAPKAPAVRLSDVAAERVRVPTTQPSSDLGPKFEPMTFTTRPAPASGVRVRLSAGNEELPRWWTVQVFRAESGWELSILPGTRPSFVAADYPDDAIQAVAVRAIDAAGNESPATIITREQPATQPTTRPTTRATTRPAE